MFDRVLKCTSEDFGKKILRAGLKRQICQDLQSKGLNLVKNNQFVLSIFSQN